MSSREDIAGTNKQQSESETGYKKAKQYQRKERRNKFRQERFLETSKITRIEVGDHKMPKMWQQMWKANCSMNLILKRTSYNSSTQQMPNCK